MTDSVPTPNIATVVSAPSFFKPFRYFLVDYGTFTITEVLMLSQSFSTWPLAAQNILYFIQNAPCSQFGGKPPASSHLNSGNQTLPINLHN